MMPRLRAGSEPWLLIGVETRLALLVPGTGVKTGHQESDRPDRSLIIKLDLAGLMRCPRSVQSMPGHKLAAGFSAWMRLVF